MTKNLSSFFREEEYSGKKYLSCAIELPILFTQLTNAGLAEVKYQSFDTKDPLTIIQLKEDILLPIPLRRDENKSVFEKGVYLSLHPKKDGSYGFSYFYEDVYQLWLADKLLSQNIQKELQQITQKNIEPPKKISKYSSRVKSFCRWINVFTHSR